MLPTELQTLTDQMDAAESDARRLVEGLSDEQLNWQPAAGTSWSIAQCLDHLRATQTAYANALLPRLRAAVEAGAGRFDGVRPGALGRRFVAALEPPPRYRLKAFQKIVPASHIPGRQALEAYIASHAGYREMLELAARCDVNRVKVPNPFVPVVRMSFATVLLAQPAHDRRHLWQARRVREGLGT
jgi:hypothetical protein